MRQLRESAKAQGFRTLYTDVLLNENVGLIFLDFCITDDLVSIRRKVKIFEETGHSSSTDFEKVRSKPNFEALRDTVRLMLTNETDDTGENSDGTVVIEESTTACVEGSQEFASLKPTHSVRQQ